MNNEQSEFGILFVDDEQQTLKYFRRAFENEYSILLAASAKEGMSILEEQSERISILITDQRMPGERGVELLKFARREYPNIVRILTTGFTDLDEAIEAVNSGEIHRYITKPWDLNALKLELKQSMQFFLIRRERDELLNEKLSAKQRMDGVNRLRELIAMASGITITRNPLLAIRSFIEQIPVSGQRDESTKFASWKQLAETLQKFVTTSRHMSRQLGERASLPDSSVNLGALFETAISTENAARVTLDGGLETFNIEANAPLLKWAFSSLLSWAADSPDSGNIAIAAIDREDRFEIQITIEKGSWNGASLFATPPEVLGAYFACYHQYGTLCLGTLENGRFSIVSELPKRQPDQAEAPSDLTWLEEVLPRFENW